MRSAQQWTTCLICWTPNNRKQPFSATVWLVLSCRSIDRFQKCGVGGSQLGSGEMAKHKPYKFACSTLRLEGPALRKCNTKHAKPSKKAELTKPRRSKQNRELIESLIGGKQKQALQSMKTKHGNTPAQSRPPMRRPHPCIVSFLFVGFRAAQSTHSQFLSDCFSLKKLIEHRMSELETRKKLSQ